MTPTSHTILKRDWYRLGGVIHIEYLVKLEKGINPAPPDPDALQFIEVVESPAVYALQGMIVLARNGFNELKGTDPTELTEEDQFHASAGADWLLENGYIQEGLCLRWCVDRLRIIAENEGVVWKDLDFLAMRKELPKAASRSEE